MCLIPVNTTQDRRKILIDLQEKLIAEFLDIDYNVFIFGSFVRNDFSPITSDIDIGFICDNPNKRMEIRDYLKDYFANIELTCDLITVQYTPKAFVNIPILSSKFRLTDYYPDKINIYLLQLLRERRKVVYYKERKRQVLRNIYNCQ